MDEKEAFRGRPVVETADPRSPRPRYVIRSDLTKRDGSPSRRLLLVVKSATLYDTSSLQTSQNDTERGCSVASARAAPQHATAARHGTATAMPRTSRTSLIARRPGTAAAMPRVGRRSRRSTFPPANKATQQASRRRGRKRRHRNATHHGHWR